MAASDCESVVVGSCCDGWCLLYSITVGFADETGKSDPSIRLNLTMKMLTDYLITERDRFVKALPAATGVSRGITLKRRI